MSWVMEAVRRMAGKSLVSGRFESGGGSWGREVLSFAGCERRRKRKKKEKGEVGLWAGGEKKRKRKREWAGLEKEKRNKRRRVMGLA